MNGYVYIVLSKVKPAAIAGAADVLLHYINAITIPRMKKNAMKESTEEKQIAETVEKIYVAMLDQGKSITVEEVYEATKNAYYNPIPKDKVTPEMIQKYKEVFGDPDKNTNEEK